MSFLGGHRAQPLNDGPGLDVIREEGAVVKRAHTPGDIEGIRTEARLLRALSGSGFAPELIAEETDYITEEDLGDSEPVHDGELFRQNATRLLWTLREHGIRHGDLTGVNIIIKGDKPMAIDFQQSHLFDEPAPDKRKLSDSYYLWRVVAGTPSELHPTADSPRVARRWLAVIGGLGGLALGNPLVGKRLLDLGCFQGDFCAMAAADGMVATGVDAGGFRQGENSIAKAREIWSYMGDRCIFVQADIMECKGFKYDAVLLFSTWAYIVKDHGLEPAMKLLKNIVDQSGCLFFETQLAGDGPGPDFLVTDDDVGNMLGQFGVPQPLATIPVTGRPASRTVWKVTQ